jgi:hypothetical protein
MPVPRARREIHDPELEELTEINILLLRPLSKTHLSLLLMPASLSSATRQRVQPFQLSDFRISSRRFSRDPARAQPTLLRNP